MIQNIAHCLLRPIHRINKYRKLPASAKAETFKDLRGLRYEDPGIERAIDESIGWLKRAQDHSKTKDGGVARHYSLISGWGPSYPETTGYIIPTMISYSKLRGDETARRRAKKMLDWLVSIQLPEGGFQGGAANVLPLTPVTFNTGQILLGLATGVREFGEEYSNAMCRAADWLVKTQDPDGCWRKFPTPFAEVSEKTYETHVSWGLLEAARLEPDKPYEEAALANLRWALSNQEENGWFDKCCLNDPVRPLTHTIGYALRGILEGYRFASDDIFLEAGRKAGEGLLKAMEDDGFIPGRLYNDWRGAVSWACLTGSVQVAHCWLMLYEFTGESKYREAAFKANRYVRRTINVEGDVEIRGAIKGSFPIYGGYLPFELPNWACKFFIDSNMMEKEVRTEADMLSSFPFLKIFFDKNIEKDSIVESRYNKSLPDSIKPRSVDYLIVDNINHSITKNYEALKEDGKLVFFSENESSYIKLKRNILNIFRRNRQIIRLLKKGNLKYQINFSFDEQLKKLFCGRVNSRKLILSLFSGKEELKTYFFEKKFFQPFMHYHGIIASRRPLNNFLYNDLLREAEHILPDTTINECFISKTGIVVFLFQDSIVRLGVTTIGNKRIMRNVTNLDYIRKYLPNSYLKKVPKILKAGMVGKYRYGIETKIQGDEAEKYIFDPDVLKTMTTEAVNFLIELSMGSQERVKVDKAILELYVYKPVNCIKTVIKTEKIIKELSQIQEEITERLWGLQIPLIFSHGDYKLENMRFNPVSKRLNGIFDWDLASKRIIPCYDLYNLFISNEILLQDCSHSDAMKKKNFLNKLKNWEERVLWDYYDHLQIPRTIERHMFFLYWASYIDRWISYNEYTNKIPRRIFLDKETTNIISLFKEEFLNRSD